MCKKINFNRFVEKERIERTINGLIDKRERGNSLRKIKTRGRQRKTKRERLIIKRNLNSRKYVVLVANQNMRP